MAAQHIDQGEFVAQYAGELLRNVEADKRLAQYDTNNTDVGHALLVVREVLPSGTACLRFNIDATRIGNIARFFNHRSA
ncbi:Histone-lysine N-methyltransferase suvr3 [Trebouxia sp. C0010 RCD-2024]